MNGRVMNRWQKSILILLTLLPCAAPAAGPEIIIVKSSDNPFFEQSIETLINHVDREARFRILASDELDAQAVEAGQDYYYVALGLAAAQAVGRIADGAPVFNAYLTFEQYQQLQPAGQLSILLDQPLARYLAFCKLLLNLDSVGVLSDQPIPTGDAETRLLGEMDFSVAQYRIDEHNKLLPVLRRLLQQNDALLMLPRREIYNHDTLKGVLLTSYRFRKPAISYSPAHVKAGALASIYSSPADIGRHLAAVVNRYLQRPEAPAPAYEFARYYSIATNTRVARALDLTLPAEAELRAGLERIEP